MPWQNPLADENKYRKISFLFLALALVSLAFDVRIVNSISLISLVVLTLLRPNRGVAFRTAFRNPFFLGCFLIVLLAAIGLLYTHNPVRNMLIVSTKAGLTAIPFFFCAGNIIFGGDRKKLFLLFNSSLIIVTVICLVIAFRNYSQNHDSSVFFYHQLLSPFGHHAIYFSFFLFFCTLYWFETGMILLKTKWKVYSLTAIILYNLLLIFLLSSKIVIGICFVYLLYLILRLFFLRKNYFALTAASLVLAASIFAVLLTPNPVSKRFTDLKGNISILKQEKFAPDMYFNGFQFRLLNWRFTYEILKEEKAWLTGTSPGDAQKKLNDKYISVNMYQGDGRSNHGYLTYNLHNQFLESAVQSGIPGLLLVIWIVVSLFLLVYKSNKREAKIIAWSILAFCFTESMFETQYGIFLFCFFVLISIYTDENK